MRLVSVVFLAATMAACGDGDTDVAGSTSSSGAGAGATTSAGGGPGSGGSGAASSSASSGGGGAGGNVAVTCPEQPLPNGESQHSIGWDGEDTDYEVQVPASYDNTAPVALVLDLHGYTGNKDQQQGLSGFAELAEAEGFVVVRPTGHGALNSWNAGDVCCGTAQMQNKDDVGLMRAIVAEVAGTVCIDPKRIYATGLSNGGAMSHRLACEAADLFAAVAPVSYPLDFNPFDKCQPSRPIAVMHSHGTADFVVPYNGGLSVAAAPDSSAYWGSVNGCSGDPIQTFEQNGSVCETYDSCGATVAVTLCTINGSHTLYANPDGVPIAQLAWDFFLAHPLP
jgi:polyhydroxybutyrate depolymerase